MGYKYNEKAKSWEAYYCARHPITRKPIGLRRKAKSQADARRIEKILVLEVSDRMRASTVPKWKDLVEDYKKSCLNRGLKTKTVEDAYACLSAHTFDAWANRFVDTINTDEIRVLHNDRVGQRSASHKKNMLNFIRGVFEFGIEKGVLKGNPTPKLKFKIGDKIKNVLTESQIKTFLTHARDVDCEWYPHWFMALSTGMRNGELYALTWEKIDLENRKIKVDTSWNSKDQFKSTKSGDDRIVPISPDLLPLLEKLKSSSLDSVFVLPRIDDWDKGNQAKVLAMFLLGVGLPRVRFHDLRASWATLMLGKGIEPIKVMYAGGWKDLKTMMVYMRKAGIETKGITDCLSFDASIESAN